MQKILLGPKLKTEFNMTQAILWLRFQGLNHNKTYIYLYLIAQVPELSTKTHSEINFDLIAAYLDWRLERWVGVASDPRWGPQWA